MNAAQDSAATLPPLASVLLADDHPAMLALTSATLAGEWNVVGAVGNGSDFLAAADRLSPDVAVLDISMPELSGLDAASQLHRSHPDTRIVFLTVHEDADFVRAAFAAGGLGYVVKSRLASDLLPAMRAALAGHRFLSPTLHFDDAA